MLELLQRKHFGQILKFEADFGFHPTYDETSRVFDKSVGGGSLLDIGIYPIFAALSALGQPNSIEANAEFYDSGPDSKCDIIFHYNAATAYLKSTFLEKTNTEATFYYEAGIIKINSRFHEPSSVTLIDNKGHSEDIDFNYKTIGYSFEIEHFNQLIRSDKKESQLMTFKKSQQLINTLDQVRMRIGLEY
ncbi:Gfo/Idh/MocA family protein [Winogradskyella eckloniae]|uniref:Gfo/Idh/MocA family protein n=1 Tax=Winogradskyella eckloniae TaxID=1089306 RepID=UPI00293BA473|nr:hypothetical protein [Winogradskyella eckloniae]